MRKENLNNITGKFEVLKVVLKQNVNAVPTDRPTKIQHDLLMSFANDIVHTIKNMTIQEDQPPIDTRIQALKAEVMEYNSKIITTLDNIQKDINKNTGS